MAQPNIFGVTEFDQDPETAAELMRLRRQQQMADAMMGQSQQPLQGGMVGQVYVPPSITQGLAKLFQGYSAGRQSADVMDQYKKLATDRRAMEDSERSKIMEVLAGRPEQPMGPPTPTGEMGVSPARPAGTRNDVALAMMASKLPDYKKAGFQMYVTEGARKEDRAAAREDKLFQIQMAHQNNLEVIKQRAAEQRISQQQLREQIDAANERNARLVASLRQPQAPIQLTDAAGNVKLVDQRGNLVKDLGAVGKPSAGFEKAGAARKKLSTDLNEAITELEKATADGGLIDKSTGSGIGAGVDAAARLVGLSTPGAVAVGQMKPIFDLVLKMVPRFEGPQSDKDTASYKEAAGELANPNVPNAQKKAAGKEILRLMKERRGQFIDKSIEGTEADIPSSGFRVLGVEQ